MSSFLTKQDLVEILQLTKYLYTHPAGYILTLKKYKHFLSIVKEITGVIGIFSTGFPNYAAEVEIKHGKLWLTKHFYPIKTIAEYIESLIKKVEYITEDTLAVYREINDKGLSLREASTKIKDSNQLTPLEFYGHLIDLDLWIIYDEVQISPEHLEKMLVNRGLYAPEYDLTERLFQYPAEVYYDIHFLSYKKFKRALKEVKKGLAEATTNVLAMYNPIRTKKWDIGQDFLFSLRPLYTTDITSYVYYSTWKYLFDKHTPKQLITYLQISTNIDARIPFLINNNPIVAKLLIQRYRTLKSVVN